MADTFYDRLEVILEDFAVAHCERTIRTALVTETREKILDLIRAQDYLPPHPSDRPSVGGPLDAAEFARPARDDDWPGYLLKIRRLGRDQLLVALEAAARRIGELEQTERIRDKTAQLGGLLRRAFEESDDKRIRAIVRDELVRVRAAEIRRRAEQDEEEFRATIARQNNAAEVES